MEEGGEGCASTLVVLVRCRGCVLGTIEVDVVVVVVLVPLFFWGSPRGNFPSHALSLWWPDRGARHVALRAAAAGANLCLPASEGQRKALTPLSPPVTTEQHKTLTPNHSRLHSESSGFANGHIQQQTSLQVTIHLLSQHARCALWSLDEYVRLLASSASWERSKGALAIRDWR